MMDQIVLYAENQRTIETEWRLFGRCVLALAAGRRNPPADSIEQVKLDLVSEKVWEVVHEYLIYDGDDDDPTVVKFYALVVAAELGVVDNEIAFVNELTPLVTHMIQVTKNS